MGKTVQLYVEGKSDKTFFEGIKFREFTSSLGYSVKVKNLKTKGNVISNFEKFLKVYTKGIYANILVYDKDCNEFNSDKIEKIIKSYSKTFHCVAIQELEAWFIADHVEVLKINSNAKNQKDTQGLTDPKSTLRKLFMDADKGFKNEMGFAEHFADKINFTIARQHNKSLDRFLNVFESHFQ